MSERRLGLEPGSQERFRSLFPTLSKWLGDPALAVDRLARIGVLLWFGTAAARILPDVAAAASDLTSQGGVAALRLAAKASLCAFCALIVWTTMMRARPVAKLGGLRPRLDAMFGTFLVYALPLFPPVDLGVAVVSVSTALIAGGTGAAVVILTRLGRSFSIMPEARRLVTSGPYRVVRHPLYLAELVATIGTFLQFASPATALVLLFQIGFQIRRILNEETVLRRIFPDYDAYARRTARLFPGIW
jgi:protein-S-isoprenylcysteine O-methyltransferase Ste14